MLAVDDPRIRRAVRYIDSHLDRPLHLAELARVAAVERKHFSVLFKRKTGWRFSELIEHLRLERALQMLATRELTVAEVAARAGYRHVRTFQRFFKRQTGLTPSRYRFSSLMNQAGPPLDGLRATASGR